MIFIVLQKNQNFTSKNLIIFVSLLKIYKSEEEKQLKNF